MTQAELHDLVADLLEYPSRRGAEAIAARADALAAEAPELRACLAPLRAVAREGSLGALEESYAAAFDNNAERALEVGWHAFGENYTRGAFLVRMRERLRECGIEESGELPDHLSHVLRVLGRTEERQARLLSEAIVLPAVEKILAALPESESWRGPVMAAAWVLETHVAKAVSSHA
jgi:nitrate reductase delta subunit